MLAVALSIFSIQCWYIKGTQYGLFSDHVLTLPVIMRTVGKLLSIECTQFPKWLFIIDRTAAGKESIKLRYGLLIIFVLSNYFSHPFPLGPMGVLIHFVHVY